MSENSARIDRTNEHYTFKLAEEVTRRTVTFKNHFGIELAGDLYTPKCAKDKNPAIAICGPFGAVKEQSSGFYANQMAKRGFIALAFDPSFTGESGGAVRFMNSPDINTEDFMAAVDYLSTQENVDPERIGIIGICGWGGMALNTAAIDTRVKATVASTMYDMSRIAANGYFDQTNSKEARNSARKALMAQRIEDFKNGTYALSGGVVDPLPQDAPYFVKDYYDYYKTPRGYHERSLNSNGGWAVTAGTSLMNTKLLAYSDEIENAVMVLHGEKAHSRYFGEDAFKRLVGTNKELVIIPGASHTDLYDGGDKNYIPFDRLQTFFDTYLK
ncbi:MAG: alpha/beta hydrolase [Spirochaetales bacterium]|nr:alpha/beta hydrolase [Spirochaetales bacterium]